MRTHVRVTAFLMGALLAIPQLARPCSSLAFPNEDFLVFGANYDNLLIPGQLFINRRGVHKTGWEAGTTGKVASWVSRYGSVTISSTGYQLPWGGMNQAGLVFSTMYVPGTAPPAPDERPPLMGVIWWQYMLDMCATIEEVRAASADIRLGDTVDHYLLCDRTGAAGVVECIDGHLVIRMGRDLPVRALVNAPYQELMVRWTERAPGPADPYSSGNRFSRLADGMATFRGGSTEEAVGYAFELLAGVANAYTRWSFVCDTRDLVFYLKSFQNPSLRFVDLKEIDFGCGRPTAMLDAHADLEGDITAAFHDYSHEEAAAHMVTAVAEARPDVPEEMIRQILALLESFTCEQPGE
ncbi:hypothetical protein JXA88_08160 [Candidatus Fermentibacteria bacterium]|nr:hypothetical protein [Candidatus Fermentibacteria bacterium]